jgi:hypothetical protein
VSVGAQDRIGLQAARIQECQHRRSFPGIDYDCTIIIVDNPDVIILQGGNSGDFKQGAGNHEPIGS